MSLPHRRINPLRPWRLPALLVDLPAQDGRHFLVRVKKNLRRRLLEVYPDGSALVEIRAGKQTRLGREILGRGQRGGRGRVTTVRRWTSLRDWRKYPAAELLALYGRRWEQEVFYKERKVDLRSTPYLRSHTPETAAQEIAALILAYAVMVDFHALCFAWYCVPGIYRTLDLPSLDYDVIPEGGGSRIGR